MNWFARHILGHTGTALPFDVSVTYSNGTVGELHFFAEDARDAVTQTAMWMPLHTPAKSIVITLRETVKEKP